VYKQAVHIIVASIALFGVCVTMHAQPLYDAADLWMAPTPMEAMNSTADDYGPCITDRRLSICFTSERSGVAAIYRSPMYGTATQGGPELVSGTFNEEGHHRAFLTGSESGDMFGAMYLMHPRRSYMGVVTVVRDGSSLNAGHGVDVMNGEFFTSHPAVSPDGTMLVAVSDRPSGSGGTDLWMSHRVAGGAWQEPVNLSDVVNSSGDEITPYFVANDTLLYASNGYGGKGGFDVFLSVFRDGAWTEPQPIDAINSEFDESDCAMLPDGSLLFASNRPGGRGGLDLYLARKRSDQLGER
jgi:hypothetical protein